MRVLNVSNWSFGRNRRLHDEMREVILGHGLALHYLDGDADHNRTVSAFSGEWEPLSAALMELAHVVLPHVDLTRHTGVHPRIGALDVCPFVPLQADAWERLRPLVEAFGENLSAQTGVPVYLYEKSERGRHEADLPSLRKGGFGSLIGKELSPDFGPRAAHPQWGVAVVGMRAFLLAMNVNLKEADPTLAKSLARQARRLRSEGDPRFLGVRALGFPLASVGHSQVSFNLTLPDLTAIDDLVDWVREQAALAGVAVAGTELIGVIRGRDVLTSSQVPIAPGQVVETPAGI